MAYSKKHKALPVKDLTHEQAKEEVPRLINEIVYHDDLYYRKSDPKIFDFEYDELRDRYDDFKVLFPSLIPPDSLLNGVGKERQNSLYDIQHSAFMNRLKKARTEDHIRRFVEGVYRKLQIPFDNRSIAFTVEPKIDGIAVAIHYEKRKLIHALMRGDGLQGQNIIATVNAISEIPRILPPDGEVPDIFEVRGEIYIATSAFETLNEQRISAGEKPYATPRNLASGLCQNMNSKSNTAKRYLQFFPYGLGKTSEKFADSQYEMIKKLADLGFPSMKLLQRFNAIEDILLHYGQVKLVRSSLDYEIDGLVYKVDNLCLQEKLGSGSSYPYWSIAHKFSGKNVHTRILDIDIQVGRTGILTPVARLEPVNIDGVVITNVTLYNEDYITGLDIRIGDMAVVQRAGDVIPRVVDVVRTDRPADAQVFSFPSLCPVCQSPAIRNVNPKTGKVDSARRCTGDIACSAQGLEKLKHFVSRQAFDIDYLGAKQLSFFFQSEDPCLWIRNPASIFTLERRQQDAYVRLEDLPNFGKISVKNLYDAINKRRQIALSRFIFSLGIRHVGMWTAKLLAEKYRSYRNFEHAVAHNDKGLWEIAGIGDVIVKSMIAFYQNSHNTRIVEALLKEVTPETLEDDKPSITDSILAGKKVVLTGALEKITREEATGFIERLGAKVLTSVSQETDIVIVGTKPGSKFSKAQKLGIEIMDGSQFLDLFQKFL
ncbi:NAD-dependent DNA ligase LigA [Candidatus Liberibacter sp.]|uniref:NAD-dependent DNA ligase LigA n=1 Tax=Candidatus Liberibacter sp. TaxID=34022 RepID=UPI0015F39A38|nr:NAD-dependent DNA ligase LigA [Candidatus Liberibacter sp.]MBA5724397.1 NAD-dependent DNA ligase LigA [Candidatus Liberibacter sp.]